MKRVILASSSPRRKELMKLLGIPFEIVPSDFPEESIKYKNPKKLVEKLSLEKAKAVASKFGNSIIIGADTVVVLGNEILGKPKDKADATKILKLLSGTEHSIITGFTIIDQSNDFIVTGSKESKVKFKKLDEKEIEAYIATGEPMDKAGAYAVQEIGGIFVEQIEGDMFSIIGLPLIDIRKHLRTIGIKILE